MRDFRATRTQRMICELRIIWSALPDLIAGISLFAFLLVLMPILTALF